MSKLAVLGGEPIRAEPWPAWPDVREQDVEAVAAALRTGHWWQHEGEETGRFEEEFASYQDACRGIAVNSGSTALQVALEALGVGPGDEVIVPAYTFQATAMSVIQVNAVPVFADVEPKTMNISPDSVASLITDRTRSVIPVHLAGLPADIDRLRELAGAHGVPILEDAAQAHGGVRRGRKVGAIGDAGAFSFQASKNLCAGEGGIVLTDDNGIAARAAALRNCGRVEGGPFYQHHTLGYSFRMTEMQGALLRSRLAHLEAETQRRWENGRFLTRRISPLPGLEPLDPPPAEEDRRAYHLYPVRLRSEELGGITRERFMEALRAEGVPCMAGYERPVYQTPAFLEQSFKPRGCPISCAHYRGAINYREVSCPAAEEMCNQVIWLFHSLLLASKEEMKDIARAFEKVAIGHRDLVAATT
ncbi:MAG: DegT/DnrJ/EryC1/StrS family aminotransferase [Armatimonadota bacterium]|nr:MAG: DegT/DnrJ/EryC1/StrS family aminotransferase [Armatimonadota bacterium]